MITFDANTMAGLCILVAALGGYGLGWWQAQSWWREWSREVARRTILQLMMDRPRDKRP